MDISALIKVARGEEPADLLLKNARVVNVFSGEIEETGVAITHSRVIGLGNDYPAQRVIDMCGHYSPKSVTLTSSNKVAPPPAATGCAAFRKIVMVGPVARIVTSVCSHWASAVSRQGDHCNVAAR